MKCTVCSKTGIQLSKVLEAKKTTKFDKNGCQILSSDKNVHCSSEESWESLLPGR